MIKSRFKGILQRRNRYFSKILVNIRNLGIVITRNHTKLGNFRVQKYITKKSKNIQGYPDIYTKLKKGLPQHNKSTKRKMQMMNLLPKMLQERNN